MKNQFIVALASFALFACVEIPEVENLAPEIELTIATQEAYPGSSFEVVAVASDDSTDAVNLKVSWVASEDDVNISQTEDGNAIVTLGINVPENKPLTVTAIVEDEQGARNEKTVSINVGKEPFVIIDAETEQLQTQNSKPIYLTGAYSAKPINLKSNDSLPSDNKIIDVSPDGRFVFYTQLFVNSTWQARLYDSQTQINHNVVINFNNLNYDGVASYWSPDSRYLAIYAPHKMESELDTLYWIDINEAPDDVEIEPEWVSESVDQLVWSVNEAEGVSYGGSYAVLLTESSIRVLTPEQLPTVTQLRNDSGALDFNFVAIQSAQTALNQLFFLASDAENATADAVDLFHWNPQNGETKQINTVASPVERYQAFVPTKIVYQADTNLYLYSGDNETLITLAGVTAVEIEHSEFNWSPSGALLGVNATPSNLGNANFWALTSWKDNADQTLIANWQAGNQEGLNIAQWNWNANKDNVTVLSVSDETKQNTLLMGKTNVVDGLSETVTGIFQDQIGTANAQASALKSKLVRSPNGRWQLFWGVDTRKGSSHLDLWAYDTENNRIRNLSSLSGRYQQATANGIFQDVNGFGRSIDELAYVSDAVVWLTDSQLIFNVRKLMGVDELVDVRFVDISTDELAKSIISPAAELAAIRRVVGQ